MAPTCGGRTRKDGRYRNFSTDSAMCRSLEQLLREDLALSIVGVAGDPQLSRYLLTKIM